jgi:glycosyltransferase involved in cell wall biosynthesis
VPRTDSQQGGVLVANPGGVTWMIETAAALARAGELSAYCSPFAYPRSQLPSIERRLPGPLGAFAHKQLVRRATPAEIPPEQIRRLGNVAEVLNVIAARTQPPLPIWSAITRNRSVVFDRAVSRRLSAGFGAVIGYNGTTLQTFRRARVLGVPTVLDYPIPHWSVVERLMNEEARLVPEYAPTLQGHYFEGWRKRRYDAEIEVADRLIMLSTYHQRTFESIGVDPSRMFIAPLCVDTELFTPAEGPPDGTFRVAFIGQITQRKGISYLVDGFLKAELEDAELLFIGRAVGSPEPWISAPRVRHVPAMPRSELPAVLRTCHVSALPSLIEGFGATTVEAMACGLPAIVSENSLAHDVIDDGVDGWVLPIRDSDAIAACLRRLYDDRQLQREMGRAARLKAEQYPWGRYGEAVREGLAGVLTPP